MMELSDYYAQAVANLGNHMLGCKKCCWTPSSVDLGLCEEGQRLYSRKERIGQLEVKYAALGLRLGLERYNRGLHDKFMERLAERERERNRKRLEKEETDKWYGGATGGVVEPQGAKMRSWEEVLPSWRIPHLLPKGWELLHYTHTSGQLIVTVRPQGKTGGARVISIDLALCTVTDAEARRDWLHSVIDVKILWEISLGSVK